jgi:ribosome-binding protein aMBF1 (putative translation factor)
MDAKKRKKLKQLGGRVTTVKEFLKLTDEDMAVIEARIAIAAAIRKGRTAAGLTQADLAKRIGSSQARVAKMEGGDSQASLESMIRALGATGYRAHVKITRHKAA